MPPQPKKKNCGNCRHTNKDKGVAFWVCTNNKLREDLDCRRPSHFPRVLTNDKCDYYEKELDEQDRVSKKSSKPNRPAKK